MTFIKVSSSILTPQCFSCVLYHLRGRKSAVLATWRGLLFEVDNCPLYKERNEISEILLKAALDSNTHSLIIFL